MSRQSRERRRLGVRASLTDRDHAILAALNRFRIARSTDLIAFAFSGTRRDTALRRLRKLFDSAYVDLRTGDRSKDNVYMLGARGRAVLAAQGKTAGRIPRRDLEHHLAVVHAWASLAVSVDRAPGLRLDLVRSDWEIREHPAAIASALVPDALVQLRVQSGKHGEQLLRVALEIDRATEPLTILARKLARYEETRTSEDGLFGWHDYGLIVVLPNPGAARRVHVEQLLEKLWAGWRFIWSDATDLAEFLGQLRLAAAPPLTTYPCPKGSGVSLSDVLP